MRAQPRWPEPKLETGPWESYITRFVVLQSKKKVMVEIAQLLAHRVSKPGAALIEGPALALRFFVFWARAHLGIIFHCTLRFESPRLIAPRMGESYE